MVQSDPCDDCDLFVRQGIGRVQTPAKAASCTVKATLGDYTESLAIATK